MSNFLELLYYQLGFWRFVFNHEFRNEWIARFKEKDFVEKLLELLGATIATAVGLGVPAIFTVIIYQYLRQF